MKILLVDDNKIKADKILRVLNEIPSITKDDVDYAADMMTAKKAMLNTKYDLVLLDVILPLRFGEEPKINGGQSLLSSIKIGSRYKKPLYIVGLTAYDDALETALPAFTDSLWAIIKYEDGSDKWEHQIVEKVEDILKIEQEKELLLGDKDLEYMYDLGIICALAKTELESILALPAKWETVHIENDCSVYHRGEFIIEHGKITVIAAVAAQMGMTAASVLSMKIIQHFRPEYLIMTGIAAGVKKHVGYGDILIADPSWDYGAGKVISTGNSSFFAPDAKQLRVEPELTETLELISLNRALLDRIHSEYPHHDKPEKPLSVFVGPVASGSAVVGDSNVVKNILAHNRKLIGLEMETYGVYFAAANCTRPRPKTLSIKSVCDFADTKKNDRFHHYAAYTSSRLLYELATKHLSYSKKRDKLNLESNSIEYLS